MPDMNKYSALVELRNDLETSVTSVIFLSGTASRANLRKGMELGAYDYITNPYTVEELLAAIRTRLGHWQAIKDPKNTGDNFSERVDEPQIRGWAMGDAPANLVPSDT